MKVLSRVMTVTEASHDHKHMETMHCIVDELHSTASNLLSTRLSDQLYMQKTA